MRQHHQWNSMSNFHLLIVYRSFANSKHKPLPPLHHNANVQKTQLEFYSSLTSDCLFSCMTWPWLKILFLSCQRTHIHYCHKAHWSLHLPLPLLLHRAPLPASACTQAHKQISDTHTTGGRRQWYYVPWSHFCTHTQKSFCPKYLKVPSEPKDCIHGLFFNIVRQRDQGIHGI